LGSVPHDHAQAGSVTIRHWTFAPVIGAAFAGILRFEGASLRSSVGAHDHAEGQDRKYSLMMRSRQHGQPT
jgi:hypothetical protein